jgi:hypothetical protein
MNWLKRKLRRWIQEEDCYATAKPIGIARGNDIDMEGLAFSVMPATGGTVVQIRHYDRKTDRSNNVTHVIPDGEDIAERIGQIVSMEILRA